MILAQPGSLWSTDTARVGIPMHSEQICLRSLCCRVVLHVPREPCSPALEVQLLLVVYCGPKVPFLPLPEGSIPNSWQQSRL